MDPEGYDRQIDRLNEVRRSRDNRETSRALRALESALREGENVMPSLLDAVNAYATLQECCDVMRDVLGAYQEAAIV
jgi:methylmalonyl-CoA mutase N-terminal domain/subunit